MPRPINALRYRLNSGKTLHLEMLRAYPAPTEAVPIAPMPLDAVVVNGATYVVRKRQFDYDDGYLDVWVEG